VIPATDQIAERHPELDDAPLRARYALEGKLGRGGMGVVAEASDRRIGRRVAVKRLAGPPTPEVVTRFVREARVQGRLDHPAVVPVYDLGIQSDGRPYFAMRKLAGVTLAEVLHRQAAGETDVLERYPRARLLEAFVDVCLAVEYAHTRGVIHRDLKPANVMLGDFGEVYVLDWGVAITGDGGTADAGAGTVGYMAPEAARNETVDARSDVYSLGKILTDILASPLGDTTPTLEVIRSRASREDRGARYASARELADAVQRHLDADADSEARETQAGDHVARARAALAADRADPAARATAMREAGLALALDPDSRPAAKLVRDMLLEPPATMPAPVAAAIRADDEQLLRTRALPAAASYLGIVGAMVLFLIQGIRDWTSFLLLPVAVVIGGCAALTALTGQLARTRVWIAVACNFVVMLLYSRVLGPFVLPPGIAALIAMIVLTHPTLRAWWLVIALMAAGPITAWLLEEAGVFAVTVFSDGDQLELRSTMIELPAGIATIGLGFYIASLLVIAALFGRRVANAHHENRHRLAVQAWHLRRLLGGKVEQ
jgi:serine/threonine-protein kinase